MEKENQTKEEEKLKEANTCIALGLGVGSLGAGAALLGSAVCPLCFVVAPALVGVGVWRRKSACKANSQEEK